MIKKKRILTKEEKNLKLIDLGILLICLIYAELVIMLIFKSKFLICNLFISMVKIIYKLLIVTHTFSGIISCIILAIICIIILGITITIFSFPINIILLAIKRGYKNRIIENTTFESTQDLDYYREQFTGISPSTISMVANLKIEPKKDMTATIMKLYLNKNITFENNKIIVINESAEGLKDSEKYVLNKIIQEKGCNKSKLFNGLYTNKWSKVCTDESIKDGYIVNKRSKSKFFSKLIILILILVGCITIWNNNKLEEDMEIPIFEKYDDNTLDEIIINDPELAESLSIMILYSMYLISGILMLLLPIYIIIYYISYKVNGAKYRRTKEGKILIEKITAMKKFIHDYSYLDEAKKEQIVLWEDFLVYAIVLEENTNIIEEICKYKKVESSNFTIQ